MLRFAAAFGAASTRVVDTAIPADEGFGGFAHSFQVGVVVDDVGQDERHYKRVDRASGYRTRSLLAVPMMTPDAVSVGVIELLNSPTRFGIADLEVASVVARGLAALLSKALGAG
jgi:phosphoserine phosphatase